MTEENQNPEMEENAAGEQQPDELSLLKERADLMGIQYHPNIGIAKLKEKIAAKQEGAPDPDSVPAPTGYEHEEDATIRAAQEVEAMDPAKLAQYMEAQAKLMRKKDALRLVRVRVTNMNPIKANMKGEIFSAGNAEIGFVKKYVPYNAEQGWHVPNIILKQLKARKFMTHYETKQGSKKIMKQKLVPELAIEELPPLTPAEIKQLRQRQLMARGAQDVA